MEELLDVNVIIGNVLGIIGWLLLVYSYYQDDTKKILFWQILSSIFYVGNYYFLGATAGLFICFFELTKELLYYKTNRERLVFYLTLPIYVVIAWYSVLNPENQSLAWIELLPVIGSIIDGFVLTTTRNITVIGGIVSNILWVIYDVCILSFACALTDGILVISNTSIALFGYSRLLQSDKLIISKISHFSKRIGKYISKIDRKLYGDKYLWDTNYQKEIFNKNKDSMYLVRYNGKILGYVNYLSLTEEEYNKIKNSEKYYDDYPIESIVPFHKSRQNYILVESVAIDPSYHNYRVAKLIKNKISYFLKEKYRKGIHIKGMLGIAVDPFEIDVFDNCKFTLLKEYDTKEKLYELDSKTILQEYLTRDIKSQIKHSKIKILANENVPKIILDDIYNLDKQFYTEKYLWKPEHQYKLYQQNKRSIICAVADGKLIGYLNYLCVSEDKYNEAIKSNTIVDEYDVSDIQHFYKRKPNYISINSFVIEKKYQDAEAVRMITNRFRKEIRAIHKEGYKVAGINATAISKHGKKALDRFGFKIKKTYKDGTDLYLLEGPELKAFIHNVKNRIIK